MKESQDPNKKSILNGWKAFTLADAYKDRPPLQYLVGRFMDLPSLGIVYGSPGSLKSFLLADLACCVVSGTPWLQSVPKGKGKTFPVTKGPVVWIDFDNGERRTHDRFKALGSVYKLTPKDPLYYYSLPDPPLDGSDIAQIKDLAALITDYRAVLLVIDNLGAISGGLDENSAEMGRVFRNLRMLVENTGTSCLVIHHRRKATGQNSRKGDALRGHSSIEAAIDFALLLERDNTSPTVTATPTKLRGEDVTPFIAHFRSEKDENGQLMRAKFISSLKSELVKYWPIIETIWNSLEDGPKKKTELVKEVKKILEKKRVKASIAEINSSINSMYKSEYITMEKGANNSQLYQRKLNAKLPTDFGS